MSNPATLNPAVVLADRGESADLLARLLPPGVALAAAREGAFLLRALLVAVGAGPAAFHGRAAALIENEADPALASEMLPDWERAWGLPDPCFGEAQTIAERRAALLARVAAQGGQSREYFTAVAAAMGFAVTIEEFRPFRFGHGTFGQPIFGQDWIFAWRVRAPAETVRELRFGEGAWGEPLRRWGNAPLECALRRLAPARTLVLFAYGA